MKVNMNIFSHIFDPIPKLKHTFLILVDTAEEHRCMVRLMKMALGLNEQTAEAFLSPTKVEATSNGKQQNGSTGKFVSKTKAVPKKIEEDFDIVVD